LTEVSSDRAPLADDKDPLIRWLPSKACAFARSLLNLLLSKNAVPSASHLPPAAALQALCIISGMRGSAIDESKSNLTWLQPKTRTHRSFREDLAKRIQVHANRIVQDQEHCAERRPPQCKVATADARHLPLEDLSVDFVLSSPPYCTRIDYAKQTGFELAALHPQGGSDLRRLRDALMGTTTIRTDSRGVADLPRAVRALLSRISRHPSHRSSGYYARNFEQYFSDATLAVGEIARVLRQGGQGLLVLQNSYYKDIEIPLSALFCEIIRSAGMDARIVIRRPVRRTMTNMNTRSQAYATQRQYTEDLVFFHKIGNLDPNRKPARVNDSSAQSPNRL
jgi:hypothetical protein